MRIWIKTAIALTPIAILLLTAMDAWAQEEQENADDLGARIDAAVDAMVKDESPGAAVAVVEGGEIIHAEGYGLADVDAGKPITPDTVFDLASCSKQFTATSIMMLADDGKLSYGDDLRKFFPELPKWNERHPIAIEDLLRMRSGLPEYDFDDRTMTKPDAMIAWLKEEELEFPTGSKFSYVNTNYALLGFIVEKVSGKSLGQFMKERIFDPLHMASSVFYQSQGQKIPNRIYGYLEDDKGRLKKSVWDNPGTGDGNVFSTVKDLAIWAEAQENPTLVAQATLDRQIKPDKLDTGEGSRYGFGLEIGTVNGHRRIFHSGSWYGTSSWYCRLPDDDLAVIVLSNLESTADDIGEKVVNVLLGGDESEEAEEQ